MNNETLKNMLVNKVTFITGSGKNVGKTTFLNYILPRLRNSVSSLAYLTIGIDGEKEDMIFGTPKPGIFAEVDDYIITCDSAISVSDANFEVVEVFPFSIKLGKLLLLKTLRAGSIELIGPGNNIQLNYILNYLKESININTILIDGAVNRVTQLTSASDSQFIYIMKISAENLMKSINQIKTLSLVKDIPILSQCDFDTIDHYTQTNPSIEMSSPHPIAQWPYGCVEANLKAKTEVQGKKIPSVYFCEGALTNIKVSGIPQNIKHILVNDFTKIFLTWNELSCLLKNRKIYCKEKFHLCSVSVNLYDIEKAEFQKILSDNNIKEEVVFNPYENI